MRYIIIATLLWSTIALGDAEIRLPPGTHKATDGQLVSSRGLRETSDFIVKELDRLGIVATQSGPYRTRGVELTRFVSETARTSWLAIHVMREAGKTLIFFVPRAGS